MSLPTDISGLYQNVRTVNGLTLGGSVAQIMSAYGSPSWIERCYSLVQNNNYMFNVVCNTKENSGVYGEWHTKEDIMQKVTFQSFLSAPLVLVVGASPQVSPTSSGAWYGSYTTHSEYGTSQSSGDAYTSWTSAYPVISTDDKEKYIGLVTITARNLTGQTWSGDLKTYRTNVASYPYVTAANIRYYYKANLNSTSTALVNLGFMSFPKTVFRSGYYGNGAYLISYAGNLNASLGTYLLQAPTMESIKRSDLTHSWWSTRVLPVQTPYAPIKIEMGDLDAPRPPFAYYDLDDVIAAANSRGLWWAESLTDIQQNARGINTTSPYVHAPTVSVDGATSSSDTSGTNIYYNWTTDGNKDLGGSDIINTSGVNKDAPQDKTNEYEKLEQVTNNEQNQNLELGTSSYSGVGCFATYYAMNPNQILAFNDELWSSDEAWYDALISGLKLWGADPMQAVMSLRLYPFDVGALVGWNSAVPIRFGRVEMNSTGYKIHSNATINLDLGETWINVQNLGLHGDFRDYSPYTEVTLYIPFVGLTQINVNDFMNTAMRIKMTVDITTGSCCAVVYADNAPYLYLPGTIGVEIPITLNTMTEVAVSILQSTIGLAAGAIGGVAGYAIATGGSSYSKYAGITDSNQLSRMHAAEEEALASDIEHAATPVLTDIGNTAAEIMFGKTSMDRTGNSSPAAALAQPLYCYLIVSTPTWEKPDNYNHTYGKICHESGQLRSYSGFTICRNVDASGITCTKIEQEMIQNYLESGVYL